MQVHSGKSATSRAGPGQCHCLIVRGVVGRMQHVFAVEAVVGPLMQTPHRKSKSTERHHFETVETENYSRIEYNSAENELSPTDNEITMNDDAQRWRTFTPEPFSGRWSVRKQKFKRLRHHIHVRCEVASEWIRLCDMRMWCDGVAFGTLQLYTCLQIDFLTRCESTSKGGCCSDCNFATFIRSIVARLRNSNEFGFLLFFSPLAYTRQMQRYIGKPNALTRFERFSDSSPECFLLFCWVGRMACSVLSSMRMNRRKVNRNSSKIITKNEINRLKKEVVVAGGERVRLYFILQFCFFHSPSTCRLRFAPGSLTDWDWNQFIWFHFSAFRLKLTVEMILIGDLCRCTFWVLPSARISRLDKKLVEGSRRRPKKRNVFGATAPIQSFIPHQAERPPLTVAIHHFIICSPNANLWTDADPACCLQTNAACNSG